MPLTPDPANCTEALNRNYTIGTFQLFIRPEGGSEIDVGNIQSGGFEFTPTIVEHRRGIDNNLDANFKIGSDFFINFTGDEITSQILSVLLNEDLVQVAGNCQIPLTGSKCVRDYGVRLEHEFSGSCP